MNSQTNAPADPGAEPDPAMIAALKSIVPPPHGSGFWDTLDLRLASEPAAAGAVNPTGSLPPAPVAPLPPMAEVVALPATRASRVSRRWAAAAAAVLVVGVAVSMLLRTIDTDVTTTPAATNVPVQPPSVDSTIPAVTPTSTGPVAAPADTSRTATSSAGARRSTTTARVASLTLSPDGLGPLRLGMTTKQAEATGAVRYRISLHGIDRCGYGDPIGTYRSGDFSSIFRLERLASISVDEFSRLRTPQGIGVGSAVASLSAIPGARVDRPDPAGVGNGSPDAYVEIMTGDVGYQFGIENGVVARWSVGTREGLSLISQDCY